MILSKFFHLFFHTKYNRSSNETPLLNPASMSAMFLFVILSILRSKSCILSSIVYDLGCMVVLCFCFQNLMRKFLYLLQQLFFPFHWLSSFLTYEIIFAYIYQVKQEMPFFTYFKPSVILRVCRGLIFIVHLHYVDFILKCLTIAFSTSNTL